MPDTFPAEFQMLSDTERLAFEAYLSPIRFASQEWIFVAGAAGEYALIVDEGKVRLELPRDELDSEKVIVTVPQGTLIGELALLDSMPRSVSAIAETDVSGRILTKQALERMLREDARLAAHIYLALGRGAAAKLRRDTDRLADSLVLAHGSRPDVDAMVDRARSAQLEIAAWSEPLIDDLLRRLCEPIIDHAEDLAIDAVKETRIGNVTDKTAKHINTCVGVYAAIVGQPGHGIVGRSFRRRITEFADSMGVIFGLIPVTNPVSTAVFKTLISIKSRNAIILSPNRIGCKVVVKAVSMMREALKSAGAPADLLQVIETRQSRQTTSMYMRHPGIAFILATGGAQMVKAAYSSGTPAIGVGPGNTPCLIASDANTEHAAKAIVKSKAFDNGVICGSEHNLVVSKTLRASFINSLERHGAAVLSEDERDLFLRGAVDRSGNLERSVVGQAGTQIADKLGIARPYPILAIVVPTDTISSDNLLAREKMAPILSLFTVDDDQRGLAACKSLLDIEGCGHTAVIHTRSKRLARQYAREMKASRILVNSPALQGIIGLTTGLTPSFTLGCGTFGGNSTTDNVSFRHLCNIKRLAYFMPMKRAAEWLEKTSRAGKLALRVLQLWGRVRHALHI